METMQAVSFMYVRPPGYNAESAKAAELEDERKIEEQPATADMYCIIMIIVYTFWFLW